MVILVSGEISKADVDKIIEHENQKINFFDWGTMRVELDSPGGDVNAAMQIGRIIRKYQGVTTVDEGAKCFSSCALIYIAGIHRNNFGVIGLHRPYLAGEPKTRAEIERQLPIMLQQVKAYVHEMGVTDNFYQAMVNTEPSRMMLLRDFFETEKWVPQNDATYDEIQTSYKARAYGTTTSEIRRRTSEGGKCYKQSDPVTCAFAIWWGLSESVYLERHKQSREMCGGPRRPLGKQHDDPDYIKHEACIRDIMLGRK